MEENDSPSLQALVYIIVGTAILSFTSVFVALSGVGPTPTAFYRMLFGGLILLGIVLVRGDRLWFGFASLLIPFLAAVWFSLDLFFWHRSIGYVGPGLATILGNFQVFFVALIAVSFLKERLGWRLITSIPIAVVGLLLIVRTSWGVQGGIVKLGVLYGLLAALTYALYILTLRKSRSEGHPNRYSLFANMAWISLLSAAMLGLAVLVEPHSGFAIPDLRTLAVLLGLGIVGQVVGWVMVSKGLPEVNAAVAGLTLLLQPALAFMWDILFFGRQTTTLEYVGAGIVLAAIYLGSSRKK